MILDNKQKNLLEFVKVKHGDQVRKYTGEPYWTHVVGVAEIVWAYDRRGIEVALCHDLYEDTDCTFSMLYKCLTETCGYMSSESYDICTLVTDLTDVFTKEDYTYMNRKKRKQKEAERLGTIGYLSQTVKYADLIHNTKSIVEHDKGFAKVYLHEKQEILVHMDNGNADLYARCVDLLNNEIENLNK